MDANQSLEPRLVLVDGLGNTISEPAAYTLLWWLKGIRDSLIESGMNLDEIEALLEIIASNIVLIQGDVEEINLTTQSIETIVDFIKTDVTTIKNDVITIRDDVGSIKLTAESIEGLVTTIRDTVLVISTDVGIIKGFTQSINVIIGYISGVIDSIYSTLTTIKNFITGDLYRTTEHFNGSVAVAGTPITVQTGTGRAIQTAYIFNPDKGPYSNGPQDLLYLSWDGGVKYTTISRGSWIVWQGKGSGVSNNQILIDSNNNNVNYELMFVS